MNIYGETNKYQAKATSYKGYEISFDGGISWDVNTMNDLKSGNVFVLTSVDHDASRDVAR